MIGESSSSAAAPAPAATSASNAAEGKPKFKPLSSSSAASLTAVAKGQLRKIPIPPHRLTPLKNDWHKIYTPLVEMASLQVRMNVAKKCVEPNLPVSPRSRECSKKAPISSKPSPSASKPTTPSPSSAWTTSSSIHSRLKTLRRYRAITSQSDGRIAGKDGRTSLQLKMPAGLGW